MNMNLEQLGQFLAEAKACTSAKFEPSIFSIGGRGYYENPTSDLLAFFWQPDGPHGLKTLFLDAFLECIPGTKLHKPNMTGLSIQREVCTTTGARIDLLVIGSDWCLAVENKIRHAKNNPFGEYIRFTEHLDRKQVEFAVLSPDGAPPSSGTPDVASVWRGVSYQSYCNALRARLSNLDQGAPQSKWQVFAADFIEHLQQECCSQAMDKCHVDFVEKHQEQIASIKALERQYRGHVVSTLAEQLNGGLESAEFQVRDEGWAFRCRSSKWGEPDMVLFQEGEAPRRFLVRVYVPKKPEDQHRRIAEKISASAYKLESEGKYTRWTLVHGFQTSAEAIRELVALAGTINAALLG